MKTLDDEIRELIEKHGEEEVKKRVDAAIPRRDHPIAINWGLPEVVKETILILENSPKDLKTLAKDLRKRFKASTFGFKYEDHNLNRTRVLLKWNPDLFVKENDKWTITPEVKELTESLSHGKLNKDEIWLLRGLYLSERKNLLVISLLAERGEWARKDLEKEINKRFPDVDGKIAVGFRINGWLKHLGLVERPVRGRYKARLAGL